MELKDNTEMRKNREKIQLPPFFLSAQHDDKMLQNNKFFAFLFMK